jgi:hypothetical protein
MIVIPCLSIQYSISSLLTVINNATRGGEEWLATHIIKAFAKWFFKSDVESIMGGEKLPPVTPAHRRRQS